MIFLDYGRMWVTEAAKVKLPIRGDGGDYILIFPFCGNGSVERQETHQAHRAGNGKNCS